MIGQVITEHLLSLQNSAEAKHLARFFKTGKGEYGFGDKFLGIRVPMTRSIVKEYKDLVTVGDCSFLIKSFWHEIRLAGFLLLVEKYRVAKKLKNFAEAKEIVDLYIELIPYGNNWDLVDLVCGAILGDWLVDNHIDRVLLEKFAEYDSSLWHQRVAIVSTLPLIKAGQYNETISISTKFLTHKHDLIHKATGWMLREMGKRGGYDKLIAFLDKYVQVMPRTTLRYSIEHFPEELRRYYLKMH